MFRDITCHYNCTCICNKIQNILYCTLISQNEKNQENSHILLTYTMYDSCFCAYLYTLTAYVKEFLLFTSLKHLIVCVCVCRRCAYYIIWCAGETCEWHICTFFLIFFWLYHPIVRRHTHINVIFKRCAIQIYLWGVPQCTHKFPMFCFSYGRRKKLNIHKNDRKSPSHYTCETQTHTSWFNIIII